MTDEEKLAYAFCLFFYFLPLSRKVKNQDLTLDELRVLFTVLELSDDNYNLLMDVCNIVGREDTDSEIKKNFYYLLAKVKVVIERQFQIIHVSEKLKILVEYMEFLCPEECLSVQRAKIDQVYQRNNLKSCNVAARENNYPPV